VRAASVPAWKQVGAEEAVEVEAWGLATVRRERVTEEEERIRILVRALRR